VPSATPFKSTRILVALVGAKPEAIAATCAEGFAMHRAALRRELGVESTTIQLQSVSQLEAAVRAHHPDIALIMPTWRDPAHEVIAAFRALHAMPERPRLVYFDWYAPTSSPHFGVMPFVDRYLKRSVMVDFQEYRKPYLAGYGVADFVAQLLNLDLNGWHFGSEIPAGHEHKLWLGWNFGVGASYRKLLRYAGLAMRVPVVSGSVLGGWEDRPIDVNRRLGAPSTNAAPPKADWYQHYRDASAKSMEPLSEQFRCTGITRVPRKTYLLELLRSKVVFSPFGWGEVCFRDYEAVACGCLLVKPSMAHVVSSPNIYVDYETYVPVKWDLSDAADVIAGCLAAPKESARIASNARRVLQQYFRREQFVDDVGRSLRGMLAGEPLPQPEIPASSPRHVTAGI
jgi:hypothetical protein